ncbi:unnamed protein product [Notodromas monacha]|uniref:Luciferase n=1 Tax=Notodromas monacha TaxID=399045 RepID=A0A7R9BY86_9CRUS|nr:unnamed protein product [Notodromas monacha]CAG0922456.1 unnamed protein product [Notodromas monacha]
MVSDGIIKSPWPVRNVEDAKRKTVWEFIESRLPQIAAADQNKKLFIDGSTDDTLTYAQFFERAKRLSSFFHLNAGVQKGSKVIVCCKNNLNFYVPVYGASALGAIVFIVPVFSHDCIPACLAEEAPVSVIVTDKAMLPIILKYVAESVDDDTKIASKPTIIFMDYESETYESIPSIIQSSEDDGKEAMELPKCEPMDDCFVFYSSGSTGPSKPITHSHANMLSFLVNSPESWFGDDKYEEIRLTNLYQGHIAAAVIFLQIIAVGSTSVIFTDFKPDQLIPAIEKHKAMALGLYPREAIYLSKAENWQDFDLSSVREICAAAATFPMSILDKIRTIFPNVQKPLFQVYASTELIYICTSSGVEANEAEAGVGHVMPSVQITIVDVVTGATRGPNEPGEIWIKSPFRLKEYRNRPELTKAALTDDGWFKSGDYGFYDNHTRVHILDRVKDLVILQEICAAAATFPMSILDKIRTIFPNVQKPLFQVYASTELIYICTSSGVEANEAEAGVGHVMPSVQITIVDVVTGETRGPNEPGEIWIKSPFRLKEYRNRPELTKAALTDDGWFKSGDYGFYDNHTRVHILDRVKDLVILPNGIAVPPSKIEDIILQHPAVFQVGVAGIPSEKEEGCLPRAFVILKPEAEKLEEKDIVNFVAANTTEANYNLSGGAEFITGMVTSPGGKIYRMKLREDYLKRFENI